MPEAELVPHLKVKLHSWYSDGHEHDQEVDMTWPADKKEWLDEQELDEMLFTRTGDGHYTSVYERSGERLQTYYSVEVLESNIDQLPVGWTREWV